MATMASYFLPSFLTGWELPSISAAYSLSSALQRRILSYLLKRTLGHLVIGGQLDIDQIDSGLGSGKVEIRNVVLDAEAINRLLPSLPLRLRRGQIGAVQIRLPLPNLWSGELSLTLSEIAIETELAEASTAADSASAIQEALANSFLSAASEVLERDEEGRAIEESIHQSLLAEDGSLDAAQREEAEAGSIVSTFVESLLSRLKVSLCAIRIDIVAGHTFTLKAASIAVESKTAEGSAEDEGGEGTSPGGTWAEVIRVATITGAEIEVSNDPVPPSPARNEEGPVVGENSALQAAASPFPAPATRTVPGGFAQHDDDATDISASLLSEAASSMYESALDNDGQPSSTAPTEAAPHQGEAPELDPKPRFDPLLFSAGTEPIVLTLKARKERPASIENSRRRPSRPPKSSISVEVTLADPALAIHPAQICALLRAAELWDAYARHSTRSGRSTGPTATPPPAKDAGIDIKLGAKSLNVVLLYESLEDMQDQDRALALASLKTFWVRPTRPHPSIGHLRIRIDEVQAAYSAKTGSTASSASMNLTVADVGIFEHLPPSLIELLDPTASRVLPILILDPNMAKTSDGSSHGRAIGAQPSAGSSSLPLLGPDVESVDWRAPSQTSQQPASGAGRGARFAAAEDRRGSATHAANPYLKTNYGERGWKVRPSHHRSNSSASLDAGDGRAAYGIDASVMLSAPNNSRRVRVSIAPVHVFLDVSLVTRLLPAFQDVAKALEPSRADLSATVDLETSTATISGQPSDGPVRRQGLLDDLDDDHSQISASTTSIVTDAIRLEVRVPRCSPGKAESKDAFSLRQERRLGLETRSGLFIVELRDIAASLGPEDAGVSRGAGVRFASGVPDRRIPQRRGQASTSAFGCIGSIVDAETSPLDRNDPPLRPAVHFFGGFPSGTSPTRPEKHRVECRLPSIHVRLDKQIIDAVQFLADDLTQWPAEWAKMGPDDAESLDSEGLKILGSRFFGTRAGLSVMSSSTDSTATIRKSGSVAALSVSICQVDIRLRTPGRPGDAQTPTGAGRELKLLGSEIACKIENDCSPNSSTVSASVLTFSLSCIRDDEGAVSSSDGPIVGRTTEPGLTTTVRPMLSLSIESFAEPGTSYRESSIDAALSFVTVRPPIGSDLIEDVRALLKAPEGVFENVEPNEVTRLALKIRDCSLLVSVPGHPARAAASFGDVSVKTKITTHAPKTAVKLAAADINLFAIDDMSSSEPSKSRNARSAAEHWHSLRFARVLALTECKASIALNALTRPDVDVKVTKLRSKCYLCADTVAVLAGLVAAATAASAKVPGGSQDESNRSRRTDADSTLGDRSTSTDQAGIDIFNSLDEDAFRRAAPMDSVADLVDDDVPSDPNFLGETTRYHPEIVETLLDGSDFLGGDSIASLSIAPTDVGNVTFADEDVTIRILDPKGIQPVPEYFTNPELTARPRSAFESSASSLRVRITNMDFSLRLHGGYDWLSTRQSIEEEARKVRRRLQKIKQLLAEGQTPDDSVEAATSNLLGSVHIALPQDPADMDPAEMIEAMDEGLGDRSETSSVSDAGTWQPITGLGGVGGGGSVSDAEGRKGRKLQRSRRSMIDFNFRGIEVEYDLLDAVERHLSSRTAFTADTVDIIDNIKTSTWHAFLTRMQDKEAAFRRDNEARMVKVEILNLRAAGGAAADEEVRMRAKIEPLRLHVDQDALDFLKRFFAFKLPNAPRAEAETGLPPAKPFIQYAEVYPVKLKLDYKPKRVDYGLLKEGKTIELMNFFHFEGSEMTLRHITLRGIDGWARLFDCFNDIWTPDVKANQLADVLAGVAPIRTLVNVGAGVADLVLLPIEQYQKDRRLIRGVQRGATSFAKTTALEAVRLGARLATGTQVILEQAEHILGGRLSQPLQGEAVAPPSGAGHAGRLGGGDGSSAASGSSRRRASVSSSALDDSGDFGSLSSSRHSTLDASDEGPDQYSRYASQPEDIREALTQAYAGLSRGLTSAAQTILAVPMEVYEDGSASGGDGSVARPVVKAVPIAVLRGARGATEAFAKTLMGVQAQLGEGESPNAEGKYKTSSGSSSTASTSASASATAAAAEASRRQRRA
ncbi:related to APG2 - required for sporulation [Pseudozyma flocculosa]|uniref:Autophagy-related protein 2 n=1 Tax=Pseudozyma flocculosa TaxID=84751 RepID=A0A5C3EUS9_9BASI|nr:related to APG2 - required for sporulation [Pseudozyma flocculosa]